MTQQQFKSALQRVTSAIAGKPLDANLQDWLNHHFGSSTASFAELKLACETGVRDGWLCQREATGVKYGRVFKPDAELSGFSVDVVDMTSVAGPHHAHPLGEIDLIFPQDESAQFDGHGSGWLVYGPESAHSPTVSNGRSLVLYLLPEGRIEFTR